MAKANKKNFVTTIITSSIGAALSIGLIVGTNVAYSYENLLNVFFSSSDYKASEIVKEHCENVAAEGLVLLKNDNNALPLNNSETKVALLGQNSYDFVYGGSGSGAVDTKSAPNLSDAFLDAGFILNTTVSDFYLEGPGKNYRKVTPGLDGDGDFIVNEVPSSAYTDEFKNSLTDDIAVVTIGRGGGESRDLPLEPLPTGARYLQVDKNELDLLDLACSKYDKVILVMNTNNPVELGFLEDTKYENIQAALWIGGVGQEGIRAIPKILNGTYNPSGRLVDTYAYDSTTAPSYQNMGDAKFSYTPTDDLKLPKNGYEYMVFGEGIYVGYRYYETRYEDVVLGRTTGYDYSSQVQFPFGYGLSYTEFEWSNFEVKESTDGLSYDLSATVKNVGDVAGKDVVEFYVQKPYTPGGLEVAAIELIEFAKTDLLEPQEEQTVSVNVLKKDLTSYDDVNYKTYVLNQGDFYFALGKDAHDALNNVLATKGKTTANGMTYNGNSDFAKVGLTTTSVDATTYSTSSVTDHKITNALEDVDINYYESYTYLSRNDWTGTFPTYFKNGSWTIDREIVEDLQFYDIKQDTTDDAAIDAFTFVTNSTETSYVVQDLIGVPLSDSRWDDIISQLSYTQMTKLIRLGGYATEQIDRIGLPATVDKDGPSGVSGTLVGGGSAMAWPSEIVMASTWNKPMIEKLGELMGEDAIKTGTAGIYAPGANIHRSPYSGRNFEYYSEDALLSYKMAEYETRGLRSKGIITYVKHFALNDQETNRYGCSIFANEQSVREIFLKGFEGSIVGGGSTAVMAAMNRVGTRWVGAHRGMMTTILRDEWGFEGVAITDQASVPAMFYQDMISGLWAGTDMWLNTNSDFWSLKKYSNDKDMQYYIHRAAKNIVYAVTNSWEVNETYLEGIDTGTTKIFPWKALIWSLDGLIWAGTVVSMVFLGLEIIKKYKKEQ